ncbi:hypothetical protein PRZ48_014179 [Zasmidium cellare]|uniref:Secreted protein n=1 Tax=Zasmidium cellare TaxID=395010 RepID=A0ABR0E075_ZASCE|nr:hypothetical protein PRZ48_014179 [Zasmidium cellare]
MSLSGVLILLCTHAAALSATFYDVTCAEKETSETATYYSLDTNGDQGVCGIGDKIGTSPGAVDPPYCSKFTENGDQGPFACTGEQFHAVSFVVNVGAGYTPSGTYCQFYVDHFWSENNDSTVRKFQVTDGTCSDVPIILPLDDAIETVSSFQCCPPS